MNLFGFGFWYWWDVIQVITDGVVIQKEGLASPFDWIRGIGRGVFVKPNKTPGTSAKSYLLYAFLAVCFGFLGADKFYLGEMWQGAAKLLSCFNIFLLLFGWMWVAWDAFHAFFMMESVLKDGISPPMPYSFITPGTVPGDVFKIKKGSNNDDVNCGGFPCPPSISSLIPSIPIGEIYKGIVAPLMTPPLVRALEAIKSPPMPTGPEGLALPTATATVPTAATTQVLPPPETSVTATPSPPPPQTSPPPQGGGGRIEGGGGGIGAVIAGAMTALVVAGGAKGFFDILNKQFS